MFNPPNVTYLSSGMSMAAFFTLAVFFPLPFLRLEGWFSCCFGGVVVEEDALGRFRLRGPEEGSGSSVTWPEDFRLRFDFDEDGVVIDGDVGEAVVGEILLVDETA